MCIRGHIQALCKWLEHSWSQKIHGVRLLPEFGFLCYMGELIWVFSPRSENTVYNQGMIHPFTNNKQISCDRSSASPNWALCSTQKKKNKELLQPNKLGWTRCVPDFWFEFSRLLSSQNKQILLPQAYGSNTCNLHPIWDLFQAMSDYKKSQEVTLDPHYWVQTLSIPFGSTVHSSRRGAFIIIFICAALVPAS